MGWPIAFNVWYLSLSATVEGGVIRRAGSHVASVEGVEARWECWQGACGLLSEVLGLGGCRRCEVLDLDGRITIQRVCDLNLVTFII